MLSVSIGRGQLIVNQQQSYKNATTIVYIILSTTTNERKRKNTEQDTNTFGNNFASIIDELQHFTVYKS